MKRIAISGNIASGKSTVQKILIEIGYRVLDTDDLSHKLLTVKNTKLFNAFKDIDVFENGEFSRYKVGQLIFNDKIAAQKLTSIMHPQIADEIKRFFVEYKNEEFLFVGIPLLFEAKMEFLFDKVIFIYTDDDIRLERLIKRNNYTLEHAKARLSSQMSQDEKIHLCDFVIKNNECVENLKPQIEAILSKLKQE